MPRHLLDHRGIAVKSMRFGYSPTMNMIMPREQILYKHYQTTEDFIPFLLSPIYEERIRITGNEMGERKRVITGVSENPIYLDFTQGGGITLFVSPTGAGKTFALRGFIGDLIDSGYACFIVDVKNEFISSRQPVQDKFKHLLPFWRKPHPLNIQPLFPTYLMKKGVPEGWTCQINIRDMKVEDMMTTLDLKPNDAQTQILQTVWREESVPNSIDKLIWRVSHVNAAQILQNLLPRGSKLQPFAERTQMTLIRRLLLLKRLHVFGNEFPFDIVAMLQEGKIPVLCLNEDDRKKHYHSTYIAVLVRKIYEASRRIGKRIVFIFEDAGSFTLPNQANPSCKDVILKQLIPVGRKRGLYCIAAIQNLSQIPEEAVAQVRTFVFFGRVSGFDLEKIAKVRRMRFKVIREKMVEYQKYSELPNGMRGAIIWSDIGKADFGFVGAPCSAHATQEV